MVTPLGTLRKYDPETGKDVILFYVIPYDPKHLDRKGYNNEQKKFNCFLYRLYDINVSCGDYYDLQ